MKHSSYGFIIPEESERVTHKIMHSLQEMKTQCERFLAQGKYILYQPGSYNLVHIGHESYFQQVIDEFLANHPDLTRSDLILVIMADDHQLFQLVK